MINAVSNSLFQPVMNNSSLGLNNKITENDPTSKTDDSEFNTECTTCKERRYVDGSDDSSVSFQTPTHISPEASYSLVAAHEQEHVTNNKADAASKGGKVVSQSVSLYTSICPECGKAYVSGGLTESTIRYPKDSNKQGISLDPDVGNLFDMIA